MAGVAAHPPACGVLHWDTDSVRDMVWAEIFTVRTVAIGKKMRSLVVSRLAAALNILSIQDYSCVRTKTSSFEPSELLQGRQVSTKDMTH